MLPHARTLHRRSVPRALQSLPSNFRTQSQMRASALLRYKAVSFQIPFGCGLICASDHTPLWHYLLNGSALTSDVVVRGGIAAFADTYIPATDLLKNKSRPESAAEGAAAWVITERELREKLKKEREAKERELEKEVRLANWPIGCRRCRR
jgi:hypothetical protein